MSLDLKIEMEEIDNKPILRLEGRLDAVTVPILEKKLETLISKGNRLLLDFKEIDYLSSAGLRLLLSMTKRMKSLNGLLVLFAIQEEVLEIIKIAGFEILFTICSSEKEALNV